MFLKIAKIWPSGVFPTYDYEGWNYSVEDNRMFLVENGLESWSRPPTQDELVFLATMTDSWDLMPKSQFVHWDLPKLSRLKKAYQLALDQDQDDFLLKIKGSWSVMPST